MPKDKPMFPALVTPVQGPEPKDNFTNPTAGGPGRLGERIGNEFTRLMRENKEKEDNDKKEATASTLPAIKKVQETMDAITYRTRQLELEALEARRQREANAKAREDAKNMTAALEAADLARRREADKQTTVTSKTPQAPSTQKGSTTFRQQHRQTAPGHLEGASTFTPKPLKGTPTGPRGPRSTT